MGVFLLRVYNLDQFNRFGKDIKGQVSDNVITDGRSATKLYAFNSNSSGSFYSPSMQHSFITLISVLFAIGFAVISQSQTPLNNWNFTEEFFTCQLRNEKLSPDLCENVFDKLMEDIDDGRHMTLEDVQFAVWQAEQTAFMKNKATRKFREAKNKLGLSDEKPSDIIDIDSIYQVGSGIGIEEKMASFAKYNNKYIRTDTFIALVDEGAQLRYDAEPIEPADERVYQGMFEPTYANLSRLPNEQRERLEKSCVEIVCEVSIVARVQKIQINGSVFQLTDITFK